MNKVIRAEKLCVDGVVVPCKPLGAYDTQTAKAMLGQTSGTHATLCNCKADNRARLPPQGLLPFRTVDVYSSAIVEGDRLLTAR